MKSGQNTQYEKQYFTAGLSDMSRRNTREILLGFLGDQDLKKQSKNVARKAKTKKRK